MAYLVEEAIRSARYTLAFHRKQLNLTSEEVANHAFGIDGWQKMSDTLIQARYHIINVILTQAKKAGVEITLQIFKDTFPVPNGNTVWDRQFTATYNRIYKQ